MYRGIARYAKLKELVQYPIVGGIFYEELIQEMVKMNQWS